jgi:arsenate reductase
MSPSIEVLVTPGCPHARPALELARDVARGFEPDIPVRCLEVSTEAEARALAFPGSPTIRVDGADIEPDPDAAPRLACRLYQGAAGVPPRWTLEVALLRALRPRHILFLCVANSARSQMAEGIARALAPSGVSICSAGSAPARVRPQAVEVLREIGVDIRAHRSKPVDQIDAASVDAAITLCAEEVCPVFLGRAWRLHWAMPDPAATAGSAEDVLEAYRAVRDRLRERLARLFDGWGP